MEFTELDLKGAIEVWEQPFRHEIESVHRALQVVRWWRTEFKAELRGLPRTSERYRELKMQEERLENATLDLHSALLVQMNARKHGG